MIDGALREMIDESLPLSLNPQCNAAERSTGKCNAPARVACARAHIDGSDAGDAGCVFVAVALAADAEGRSGPVISAMTRLCTPGSIGIVRWIRSARLLRSLLIRVP